MANIIPDQDINNLRNGERATKNNTDMMASVDQILETNKKAQVLIITPLPIFTSTPTLLEQKVSKNEQYGCDVCNVEGHFKDGRMHSKLWKTYCQCQHGFAVSYKPRVFPRINFRWQMNFKHFSFI